MASDRGSGNAAGGKVACAPPSEGGAAFDAVVVLGAALLPDGSPSPALARRARHGADLYLAGKARAAILTGGRTAGAAFISEAEAMADIVRSRGVPAAAILIERRARSTYENARLTAFLMRRRGWRRALVVSDPAHLPRACMTFRAFGIDAVPAPVPESRSRLRASLREAVARGWYALRLYAARRR